MSLPFLNLPLHTTAAEPETVDSMSDTASSVSEPPPKTSWHEVFWLAASCADLTSRGITERQGYNAILCKYCDGPIWVRHGDDVNRARRINFHVKRCDDRPHEPASLPHARRHQRPPELSQAVLFGPKLHYDWHELGNLASQPWRKRRRGKSLVLYGP